MQAADKKMFSSAMAQMFSIYATPVTEDLLVAFWKLLSSYTIDAVTAAMSLHMRDIQYGWRAPTPADLLKHLEVTMPQQRRAIMQQTVRNARELAAPVRERLAMLSTERSLGLCHDAEAWRSEVRTLQLKFAEIMGAPAVKQAIAELEPERRTSPRRGIQTTANIIGGIKGIARV